MLALPGLTAISLKNDLMNALVSVSSLREELAHLPGIGGEPVHVLPTGPAQGKYGPRLVGRLLHPSLVLLVVPDAGKIRVQVVLVLQPRESAERAE